MRAKRRDDLLHGSAIIKNPARNLRPAALREHIHVSAVEALVHARWIELHRVRRAWVALEQSHDVLAKGTMEETPLETWRLLALPPQYPKRSREEVKARTLLGALECLRSGMTTVQDMVTLYPFDPEHLDAVIEAYEEIGIRAVARAGMTLPAGLPQSMVVIARVEGSKCCVPRSRGSAPSLPRSLTMADSGFFARCG